MIGGKRRSRRPSVSPLIFVPPSSPSKVRDRRLRRSLLAIGRVVAALSVLVGTVLGVTVAAQPARADLMCELGAASDPTNIGPEKSNAGTTAWVPFLAKEDVKPAGGKDHPRQFGAQHAPDDYTLWEVVGPRGLKWSYSPQGLMQERRGKFNREAPEDNFEDKCSVLDASGVMIAQMIWEISRFLAGLTIGLKQIATADAPFAPFYDSQSSLIDKLRNQLFIPAIALGVMVTGFWVAMRIHRRADARDTYAGVIGGAVIVVLLVAILTGGTYKSLTGAIDRFTSEFNSAVLNILAVDENEPELGPCYLPATPIFTGASAQSVPGYAPPPDDHETGSDYLNYNRGKRMSSCMLYKLLLFDPWVNGQFGTTDYPTRENLWYNTDDVTDRNGYCVESPYRCMEGHRPGKSEVNLAVQQVIAQAYTRNETIPKRNKVFYPPEAEPNRLQLWKGVQYAVADKYPQYYDTWKGAESTGRMATAIGAAVMNLIVLVAIGFIAVLTIFWHGVLFVAWILLPVVAAVAIFPPARRILRAVVGIMVQAIFLRNVLGLVLVILLSVMSAIQVANGATAMKIILMIIAAIAIWKLLGALRSGALGPQIVQEAAQHGVLPSDEGVDRGFRRSGAMAAGLTAVVARRQYGRFAGGRAGAAAARTESPHQRDSIAYRDDVARGRAEGRRQGGRSATPVGRARQAAEYQATSRVTRDLQPSRRRKQVEIEEEDQKAENERREAQREREDQRHKELIEELRRNQTGG